MTLVMAFSAVSVRRAGADMRLLRAAVFTAVCVALSATAHSVAAGHAVGGWPLLAGWLAVFATAAPLAGRERSQAGIAAGLAAGQLALHLLFNAGEICARPSTAGRDPGLMEIAGRLLCNDDAARLTPTAAAQVVRQAGLDPSRVSGMSGMHAQAGSVMASYSLAMVIGHLLAALAAGWLLRSGEAALWRLVALSSGSLQPLRPLRRALALVRVLVGGVPAEPASGPRRERFPQERQRLRTATLRHSVARRGPPLLAPAA
jgi:hypothetical protein